MTLEANGAPNLAKCAGLLKTMWGLRGVHPQIFYPTNC